MILTILVFFLSLGILIIFVSKRTKRLAKNLIFNTALILHNFNVQNRGYRVRMGHLCRWLEVEMINELS